MAVSRLTASVVVLLRPVGCAQAPNPLVRLNSSFRDLTRSVSPAVVEVNVIGYAIADETLPDDDAVTRLKKQLVRRQNACPAKTAAAEPRC